MPMALEGIRVLDLSRLAPGPYCSMILGDLGAEIIRVEAPEAVGSEERRLSGNQDQAQRRRVINPQGRNKRSIVIDLKKEEGRQVFLRLAKDVDVILEEFRPGVVKRLGVDFETVRQINPRVVYCSLSGYGQYGPYAQLPGHDINYISVAGALSVITGPDGSPVIPSNLLGDMAGGGMHAAMGILAALVARSLHGVGQHVDAAMTDGVVSLLHFEPMWAGVSFFGRPYYSFYETQDGKWISIGSLEAHFWANFCRAMGREDFVPCQGDVARYDEMAASFRAKFKERTRDEWFAYMRDLNICVAPAYAPDEVPNDPQLQEREMFVELEHPKFGKIRQAGISLKLSETPGRVRFPAALPGEHTDGILQEAGYLAEEIRSLRSAGVVA